MYAYLKGKLTRKTPAMIYLDCGGVGYQLHITLYTYSDIEAESEARLFTYLHVREDAMILYGFSTEGERDMFILLIGVSGVGPNTARLILSSMTTNELARAIIQEEVVLIQKIKGIGPKSAKRLVLELKDKVQGIGNGTNGEQVQEAGGRISEEAVSALVMLGFGKPASEKAVMKVLQNSPVDTVEELLKLSLKNLS